MQKIANINRVMDALGIPLIAGLCEVETKAVVQDIVRFKNMAQTHAVVHFESADNRGIDNALIYDSTVLKLESSGLIPFDMPNESSPAREIIWAKFSREGDSILAIVNHWPSRIGGQAESEPKRLSAALAAKEFIDSTMKASRAMKVVFMGDLNDHPTDRAPQIISELLTSMIAYDSGEFEGTHFYRGEWGILDHIMVSKNFKKKGVKLVKKSGVIHSPSFLLAEHRDNLIPNRTYTGSKYLGGYSDHLPVSIRVSLD